MCTKYFIGTSNDPLAVGVKAYLIYFLLRCELEVVLEWILWKNLSRPDFLDSETAIYGVTFLTDFYKRVHFLLKKDIYLFAERKLSK